MIKAALRYAGRGCQVFPLMPGTKVPLPGSRGCNDGTTDAGTINRWWQLWPDANIGLLCGQKSNLVVLDYDCKHGKRGLETFEYLRQRFGIDTLTDGTPSGGRHQFFPYVPGLKNWVDAIPELPGLDIRTDNGYVVLPPSIVDGTRYQWTNGRAPAEMPQGLIAMLQPRPKAANAHARVFRKTDMADVWEGTFTTQQWAPNRLTLLDRARQYVDAVPGAIQGQGGDVLTFKLACRLVRGFALTDAEALSLLLSWNYRCQPPWTESQLAAKIASARRNGKENIGCRLEYRG